MKTSNASSSDAQNLLEMLYYFLGFQGGAIYVATSKLDVKGSNFIQNQVGHELPEKGCDLECLVFNQNPDEPYF